MAEKKCVRIGFVGVGGMGQCAHLRNYAVLPDCKVAAIAEVREKTAAKVAQRYGVPKVYTSHQEMLANEELDGIVASQPFTRHGILLPELIQSGKPIFIEKPLSSTLDSGKKILQVLQDSAAWVMVGYHKRSDPASMYAKAEVERLKSSGELGKMTYIRILMPAGDWVANGFLDLIDEGDRVDGTFEFEAPPTDMDKETNTEFWTFVNYYIHQVNLLHYFLGESYKVTFADPGGVLLAGQSESGVTCAIEMSPYQTTVDWQESVLVAFERGYVKVSLPAPMVRNQPGKVEILRDPGEGKTPVTEFPQMPWVHAMQQQASNFIAAIRGERPPMTTAPEAMEDLKVAREYIRKLRGK